MNQSFLKNPQLRFTLGLWCISDISLLLCTIRQGQKFLFPTVTNKLNLTRIIEMVKIDAGLYFISWTLCPFKLIYTHCEQFKLVLSQAEQLGIICFKLNQSCFAYMRDRFEDTLQLSCSRPFLFLAYFSKSLNSGPYGRKL